MCSNLTIKSPERRFTPFASVSIVDFETVNISRVITIQTFKGKFLTRFFKGTFDWNVLVLRMLELVYIN